MPAVPHRVLVRSITEAFAESKAIAVIVPSESGNPRRFVVRAEQNHFEVWIYIWSLTHGGGAARPRDEYRIQLTGVSSPLQMNSSGGPTLLMGFESNTKCFAGFDVEKHHTFSTNSPSIQIPLTTLHEALQNGLSFARKGNNEVAIGVRPDQFLTYVQNARILHKQGAYADVSRLLLQAAKLEAVDIEELESLSPERQRIVSTVSRLSRDANFRLKVLNAYERRCSVTRIQLGLVDAAHILPVGIDGSTDDVSNGISLSPTYHRAYDKGLIFLDESLVMKINAERISELGAQGLTGGMDDFSAYLNKGIHLPQDRDQWPDSQMIQEANRVREIN